jgi:hypothetical protein
MRVYDFAQCRFFSLTYSPYEQLQSPADDAFDPDSVKFPDGLAWILANPVSYMGRV